MSTDKNSPWIPLNFLALPEEKSNLKNSRVVLLPVPYDSTTSYRTGARDGPMAILRASYNLEDYDHELDFDVSQVGIHTTPFLEPHMGGPRQMVERIEETVHDLATPDNIVGLLGGEHTISVGAVKAMATRYPDLSVLYLDAHGDLRDQYMDTPWSHATVARRLQEICPLVQIGVRSISLEERDFIKQKGIPTFFWDSDDPELPVLDRLLPLLTQEVYISIDLDVLDPSIMAAVGTPEPGGMSWRQITWLIRKVAERRRIVGFDVTELSPGEGPTACSYTAAKLVYKLIGYSTLWQGKESAESVLRSSALPQG
ncbi:MAG: agmatinase [Dehalococcoidia bacterium]